MRWTAWCAMVVALVVLGLAGTGGANVLLAKNEALDLAFPGAERLEERAVFLSAEQKAEIERRSGAEVDSQLWTIWVGWKGETVLGYAIIDDHVVRTLPEAFMVVLEPDGTVRRVEILAFYEPLEYMPSDQWMSQFDGASASDELTFRREITSIAGSTLTAVAMAAGVRRVLALFDLTIGATKADGGAAAKPPAAPSAPAPTAGAAPEPAAEAP